MTFREAVDQIETIGYVGKEVDEWKGHSIRSDDLDDIIYHGSLYNTLDELKAERECTEYYKVVVSKDGHKIIIEQ